MAHVIKLLITGGHVTGALAVIDELLKTGKSKSIVFVGRKYVNDNEKGLSFEYQEVTARNIHFIHLETGRLTWILSFSIFVQFFKVINGLIKSYKILSNEKPVVILSFGGYIALPVAIIGKLLGIKIVTHEQTIEPGTANRIIGRIAKKICISFPETSPFFDKNKVVLTGNPVRLSIFKPQKKLLFSKNRPCIYVTGGSIGSHAINVHVENILKELLKKYTVIHQCGNISEFGDFERLESLRNSLSQELKNHYIFKEHFLDSEIADVYDLSDLVVSRSGANTFFELVALSKPALFIPLPWSARSEQQKHAQIFKNHGAGEIFFQDEPSAKLLEIIDEMFLKIDKYRLNLKKLAHYYKPHAQRTIIQLLFEE